MTEDRPLVLKNGNTFAVFDRHGDILQSGSNSQGIYHEGTRFLSRQELRIESARPLLLSSAMKDNDEVVTVDLTNAHFWRGENIAIPRDTIHIFRSKLLWGGSCYEELCISNFGSNEISVTFSILLDADYSDIFEVRGTRRKVKGRRLPTEVDSNSIVFSYEGLDHKIRNTVVKFSPTPENISPSEITFNVNLKAQETREYHLKIACDSGLGNVKNGLSYHEASQRVSGALAASRSADCGIHTSNQRFNDWLSRSFSDLHMMLTDTPHGVYPYAGIPWFSTIFGRDGIITALQTLWVNPDIAKGVLANLAATQANEIIPEKDAEPGKILHETRNGEMANLGEVPFQNYYGTIDATPLFVVLAGAYLEHTGDVEFVRSIWHNIEKAIRWIDEYGDRDGDGFVEYKARTPRGLSNQGWKDSADSISHENGELAEGPIALCEVQGYVYEAKVRASETASMLGYSGKAAELFTEAQHLKARFQNAFWLDDLSVYALALDGDKRPCRVISSNAGHCLYTGIADAEKAAKMAKALMSEYMFSQWGIRTLASTEVRYNPISYHNGSIWPHDNSVIAMGLARYGFSKYAMDILAALFDASLFMDFHRLPELYCGFPRRKGEGPTLYPVACSPQAWAVGSLFLTLQACLGFSVDGLKNKVSFQCPVLPEFLREVQIRNLRVGGNKVDLQIERYANDVGINILGKEGAVSVVVVK